MICKIAESDVETDVLDWQMLGANSDSTMPVKRSPAVPASPPASAQIARSPSSSVSRQTADAGGTDSLDANGLKKLMAEMEGRRAVELDSARRSGLDEGLKQGRREAAAEMEEALNRLAQTIQSLAQIKRKVRAEAENELVKLSLAIARRVLHREITADPQSLRGVVYAALQRLQNREITRIRVFPASAPAVRAALERNGGLAAIEIVPDGMLQPGALLLETALGDLDASVETQLQEIERGFADRLQLR